MQLGTATFLCVLTISMYFDFKYTQYSVNSLLYCSFD